MTAPRLSPAELVAALRNQRPHTPHPVYVPSMRERDGEPMLDVLDDDVRERGANYTREYGAMLTRGGW